MSIRAGMSRFSCLLGIAFLVMQGCGGGGSDDPPATPNQAPAANAGPDQNVNAGATVTLAGSGTDSDGTIALYGWTQTGGPAVSLSSATAASPTFVAPVTSGTSVLTFSLVVTDNRSTASAADTVTIAVGAGIPGSGKVTFARVPFLPLTPPVGTGLNYLAESQDPARFITVEAVNATTNAVVSTAVTDQNGDYTILLPPAANVFVRAVAKMSRVAPEAFPRWQFAVRDMDVANSTPYTYASATFASGTAAVTKDIQIPSGFTTAGTVSGTRASAPFAMLDTVYKACQLILTAAPNTDFPQLTLDWAANNPGFVTFYDSAGGAGTRHITVAAEVGVDTDEFDEHIIAHEFGHYIEDRFSRSDSIGGDHGPGDRLDLRTAFGEGFGYAFSAMVLNDPIARDSIGANQSDGDYFDVEADTHFTDAFGNTEGWYSEASVQEILWDLYDGQDDGVDSIQLPFEPIWQVLTNGQRTTTAETSIFSFLTALKAAVPGNDAGIDALVSGEAMVANTDAFGINQTNAAFASPTSDVLPVYTPIAVSDGGKVVRSINAYGTSNKLSNARFLRLDIGSAQNVRIVATANPSGRDVDIEVLKQGVQVGIGETNGDESFTMTLQPGTYVLDTYDCGNAECGDDTPMPVDITVTVTPN